MTISGESARRDLWTASETRWVRFMARISFAQNEEKDSTALVTCSASSRVGTSIRADVLCVVEVCRRQLSFLKRSFQNEPVFV